MRVCRCKTAISRRWASLAILLLSACAHQAPRLHEDSPGARVAAQALTQIGEPYRYGGDSAAGFDCSGLALFAHARAGIVIPRTAELQQRAATPVARADLQPGDLLFFRIGKRRVDHVGVYIGAAKFIHAPRAGGVVSIAYLEDPYFSRRFFAAGRFR